MKDQIPYEEAKQIAERVVSLLRDHCERIEIAGSVRRKKQICGDIEIVCIPKPYENKGIFVSGIAEVVNEWEKVKGELGPACKYTQRILPEGVKLDIFFANAENWGWQFALRTGSSDFNFKYLDAIKHRGMKAEGGHILNQFGNIIPLKEEKEFFDIIGMKFTEPEYRKSDC